RLAPTCALLPRMKSPSQRAAAERRSQLCMVSRRFLWLSLSWVTLTTTVGCVQRHSESWQLGELVFTNRFVDIYWEGTESVDRTAGWYQFLGGSKHNYEV